VWSCGWNVMLGALGFQHTTGRLTHPHPQSSPPSEQQQHSKVSLRRAVDAV
jgi:hypothetical protein